MTLKDRIVRILKKNNLKYADLCKQLGISDKELNILIEEKNVRVMEDISKLLGIPLYSFYNDPKDSPPEAPKKRHYKEDIWKDDDKV